MEISWASCGRDHEERAGARNCERKDTTRNVNSDNGREGLIEVLAGRKHADAAKNTLGCKPGSRPAQEVRASVLSGGACYAEGGESSHMG